MIRSARPAWSGYDAGKKIKGRKRHIMVDTVGLPLNVHPAEVQDRDGAIHLLHRARRRLPFIKRIFADGSYAGEAAFVRLAMIRIVFRRLAAANPSS